MIANNKKNRFAKVMSLFLVGIFAVFLAFMPFIMNKKTDKVMADSVYLGHYFISSNTIIPVNNCTSYSQANSLVSSHKPMFFNFALFGSDGIPANLKFYSSYNTGSTTYTAHSYCYYDYNDSTTCVPVGLGLSGINFSYDSWNYTPLALSGPISPSSGVTFIAMSYYVDTGFVFNIVSVDIAKQSRIFGSFYGTQVSLTDVNGKHLYLQFPLSSDNYTNYGQYMLYDNSKSYYLVNQNNLTDNQFYNQGYGDGYTAGESAGYNAGNDAGYSAGYSAGEDAGYNLGVVAGGNVSWTNLFGAMVDVPVSSLTGMLDFNLNLGGQNFNLYHFLLAVLTLAITIAIVRLILAKGGK